ncbi:putative membrane protein [Leptospira ryugenii]|uniref:Putative membrane protein n=2 Tax=Leptospira ryugenii TaxID=1917863 RepID=A0A2P2DYY5_9LEPT|nr:putative membrane protein [Leptospira ryugenii]
MMVVPDWFLSGVLSVLVFPEDGFAKIGTVSAYMAGLWSIPLFVLVYTGIKLEERSVSIIGTCLWVAFLSVVVFGLSEAFSNELGSWYAQNVKMSYGIAHYVLVPEMILSVATYLAYQGFSTSPLWMQIPISFLIMVQYAGSLAVSYLFFEKIM